MRALFGSDPEGARSTSVSERRRDRVVISIASVLIVGLLLDQLRVVLSFGRYHVDEDQTLLWYAGRELLSARLYEPNFYGQTYNTVFEALPGALIQHISHLSWSTSMPLGTALLAASAWIMLAAGAFRRGQPIAALVALAAPLVMRSQYLLLFDAPRGVLSGDCAACFAIASSLGGRRHPGGRVCLLVAVGGLGILWDYAAALAVVPALVYVISNEWPYFKVRTARTGLLLGIGALLPLAWLLFSNAFYGAHPDDLTFQSVSTRPHWTEFVQNIQHLEAYVSFFAPGLTPVRDVASVVLVLGLVVVATFAISRRAWPLILATCSLFVLICLALSLDRAGDYVVHGLYLSGPRLLLTLPFGMWILALGVCESMKLNRVHVHRLAMAILAVTAVSQIATQVTFTSVAARAVQTDMDLQGGVFATNPVLLSSTCTHLTKVYRATNAQLLVINNLNVVYGCAAEDNLNTFDPTLDRRGWVIENILHKPLQRILLGLHNCQQIEATLGQCTSEPSGLLLVRIPSVPVARVLNHIAGMNVRRTGS
jgi:hypothetical protein